MIIGPAWPFLGLVVAGILAFSFLPGCGLAVADKAPADQLRLDAPALVQVDPRVEAETAARSLAASRRGKKR